MSPNFSAAVDPLFSYVLDLLDRIERGEVKPDEERQSLLVEFDRVAANLSSNDEWELAKYALACWIDDVLLSAPWPGVMYWNDHKIETELFRSNDRAVSFFQRAKDANQLVSKDALEVFYLCVVLGFRGIYNEAPAVDDPGRLLTETTGQNRRQQIADLAVSMQLPATLTAWVEQTANTIHAQPRNYDLRGEGCTPCGAEPRRAQAWLIGVYLVAALLGAFTFIAVMLSYRFPAT